MSFLSVVPDNVAATAGNLENLGSAVRFASAAAATQTTAIAAPAADEISTAIATLFGTNAQEFQTLSANAAAFHDQFVNLLNGGATQYLSTEVANAQQTLANAVNTPAQALLGHPLIGTAKSAAAAPSGPSTSSSSTETINTPFGPVTLTSTENVPADGNGPVSFILSATTPVGNAELALNGSISTVITTSTLQLTGGTLAVPAGLPLLLGAVGPYVTGGFSLVNSANTFVTAVNQGNVLGAATAFVSAPFDLTGAVLFGQDTITVPLGQLGTGGGSAIDWQIPFSGIFAPLERVSVSWPSSSYYDSSTGTTADIVASQFALQGTRFGGIVPELLNLFGISI